MTLRFQSVFSNFKSSPHSTTQEFMVLIVQYYNCGVKEGYGSNMAGKRIHRRWKITGKELYL